MRHKVKKVRLGREKAHRTAMLKNLLTSTILYEKVQTTVAKAKAVQPMVEKLITLARAAESGKKPKREVIREFDRQLFDKNASRKLLEELGKRYADRNSGFTRITHLGNRPGDAAPKVQLELV